MIRKLLKVRIPSLLAIMLLLVGVGVTSFMVDRGIIFEGRAAPEKTPLNIAITNVTPHSFTVMYTTEEALPGSLSYGIDASGTLVARDDRDQSAAQMTTSKVHHITVKNLNAATTYYFSILSGDTVFKNNADPYKIMTAPALTETTTGETPPIKGSIQFASPSEKGDIVVLMNSDTTQPLSALVTRDGSYTLPTTGLRTKDLSSVIDLKAKDPTFTLLALSGKEKSDISVVYSNTDPVPLITLGQVYDFTIQDESSSDTASSSATFPTSGETSGQATVSIVKPEAEEKFTDQQPVFTGTAVPGQEISVEIHSPAPIKATVKVNADGSWQYRPITPLEPGQHTLTISTRDVTGTLREFTRSFTVFAQGSQFVEPSVSPTRTPTPTLTLASPTPTASPSPTLQPTLPASPTPTVVLPSPTVPTSLSPTPTRAPIPATGSTEVVIGGAVSITALLAGFVIFFVTKGSAL